MLIVRLCFVRRSSRCLSIDFSIKFWRARIRDDGLHTRSHESGQFHCCTKLRLFHSVVFCIITPPLPKRVPWKAIGEEVLNVGNCFPPTHAIHSTSKPIFSAYRSGLIHAEYGNIPSRLECTRRRSRTRSAVGRLCVWRPLRYSRSVCQTSCRSYSHKCERHTSCCSDRS